MKKLSILSLSHIHKLFDEIKVIQRKDFKMYIEQKLRNIPISHDIVAHWNKVSVSGYSGKCKQIMFELEALLVVRNLSLYVSFKMSLFFLLYFLF